MYTSTYLVIICMAVSALAIPVPDSTVAPEATPSSVPTDLAVLGYHVRPRFDRGRCAFRQHCAAPFVVPLLSIEACKLALRAILVNHFAASFRCCTL
ncbi:hypothetical protein BC629DRAFT_715076 [Irpex lacteus]|nr:hypothetical protein BC629DRAFT_715076 [Irpex lacteus]